MGEEKIRLIKDLNSARYSLVFTILAGLFALYW